MKTYLERILEKKKKNHSELTTLRNRYIAQIYQGFHNNESVREIHKKLFEETLKAQKAGWCISKPLLKEMKKLTTQSLKKDTIANAFIFLTSVKVLDKIGEIINQRVREIEVDTKKVMLTDFIDTARYNARVFYLASEHDDCAEDHEKWQGKIYVDEKWRSVINDTEQKKQIERYIKAHNIKTFQWVIGKPVWFITRPNCRHFFKSITTDNAINVSPKQLLKTYNMYQAVGSRGLQQTIRHSTRKDWYKKVNVENLINKYEQRKDLLENMNKVEPTEKNQYAIVKTKLLIKKWRNYLKSNF